MESDVITLYLDKEILHPGDEVKGRCVIGVSDGIAFNCVKIYVHGFAETKILHKGDNNWINVHRQKIYYIKAEQCFSSTDIFGQCVTGAFEIPFSFYLPHDIPSSLSAKHGNITYRIGVEVNYKYPFDTSVGVMEGLLQICNPTSMGSEKSSKHLHRSLSKDVDACFVRCGNVTIEADTDRTVYRKGDTVKLKARVENTTHKELEVSVELYQKATFKAKGELKEKEFLVAQKDFGIRRQEIDADHLPIQLDFDIPDVPRVCPSLLNCDLISIKHRLKLTLKVLTELVDNSLDLEFPIVIAQSPTDTCLDLRD